MTSSVSAIPSSSRTMLCSIHVRLALIVLIAAIPLLVLSVTVAATHYRADLLIGGQAGIGARHNLILHALQLGLLVIASLAAVAAGAHLALVRPLTRLSRSVTAWRAGGVFDPGALQDFPTELRELAEIFEKATQELARTQAQHDIVVAQQALLMKEIHHRVKNNLQIVASLLNLQASRIREPEAQAEFASARDRVRALATLHRYLYMQPELNGINMPAFLTELCGQLFQALGEAQGGRITLHIEACALHMSSDQAVPLSLIVTESVSNALKYAFPGGRSGQISVGLIHDDVATTLTISDNGTGIDSAAHTGKGIGITLIRGFARQLGATLSVTAAPGTGYIVRIPAT